MEARKPKSKGKRSVVSMPVWRRSNNFLSTAPAMIGAESRKENLAAASRVNPRNRPVAIVIPAGLGAAFSTNGFAGGGPSVQLLSDVSDRIAPQVVLGLLQKVAMTAAPDLLIKGGMSQFEKYAGAMTPQQKAAVDEWLPRLKAQGQSSGAGATTSAGTRRRSRRAARPPPAC